MEKIITNPGLQHLAENIFWNLNVEDLKICGLINQSCQQIFENPMFWLRKFESLSKENQKDWIKVIQSEKNAEKNMAIIAYLQWNLKKFEKLNAVVSKIPKNKQLCCYCNAKISAAGRKKHENECILYFKFVGKTLHKSKPYHCQFCSLKYDTRGKAYNHVSKKHIKELEKMKNLPCYSNPDVQDNFTKRIREVCEKEEISDEDTEIVKILAPLTENPNAPDRDGYTPIYWAACNGHIEIVKILATLADNPNAPNNYGRTPIDYARTFRHTEIVKILEPFLT